MRLIDIEPRMTNDPNGVYGCERCGYIPEDGRIPAPLFVEVEDEQETEWDGGHYYGTHWHEND